MLQSTCIQFYEVLSFHIKLCKTTYTQTSKKQTECINNKIYTRVVDFNTVNKKTPLLKPLNTKQDL